MFKIERNEFGHKYTSALKIISIPQTKGEIDELIYDGMDEKSTRSYFEDRVKDIVSEYDIMSKMKGNSNIVSCEDFKVIERTDSIGWNVLIRMEYLTPIDKYFAGREITAEEIIKLGKDMCKALEICRAKNIIHRDIKPSNIFVSDVGEFKLGDFGVARVLDDGLNASSKKGTYEYMAPEIYKGEKYDGRADIYSVGIVLYKYLNNNRLPLYPQPPQVITFTAKDNALSSEI